MRRYPLPQMFQHRTSRGVERAIMTPDSGRDVPSTPGPRLVPAVDHFEPPAPLTPDTLGPIIRDFEEFNRTYETFSRASKGIVLVTVKLLRSWAGDWAVQELRDRFPDLLQYRQPPASQVVADG